jgi:hypothetical protein
MAKMTRSTFESQRKFGNSHSFRKSSQLNEVLSSLNLVLVSLDNYLFFIHNAHRIKVTTLCVKQ